MSVFSFQSLHIIFVLMLVSCTCIARIRAGNVILRKNNMINMADQDFDLHKLTKRRDLDSQTCVDNFDIHRDKIIRTEDSREMGAKYLNEIDLGSRDECLRLCCETDSCDVFVFEEKSPGSCYLFHCGPPEDFKCKFTRHTNFSSAVLAVNRHLAELEDQIKLTKHEQDLASLRKQVQEGPSTAPKAVVTARPVSTALETAVPPPARRCSRYQFECHSSEECIAIYNACDGIPQCADGSDEAPELGCPATTTLPPPPHLPPREIMPQMPAAQQMTQMHNYGGSDAMPKQTQNQHQQAFMRPMGSVESPPWPTHLDQSIANNPIPRMKQYNDNSGGSHIFNHKGGLQVTETDSVAAGQYDYKGLPYDSLQENNWQHRQWPQPQPEQMNANDGSPIYHMEMETQNAWKQQIPLQNIPVQHSLQNGNNQLPSQRLQQSEKMSMQAMPNMFQDRDKMWAVPQIQNAQQDNQQVFTQPKIIAPQDDKFADSKPEQTENQAMSHSVEKNKKESLPGVNDESEEESEENNDNEQTNKEIDSSQKARQDYKSNKKHSGSKKKHLKPETEEKSDDEDDEKIKNTAFHEQMIMGKQFEDDVHDGAAERPPGAILLLTLGVCMASIMVVLIGCRLKMARRRMRRSGKSPFAHDADYLVNGMYL